MENYRPSWGWSIAAATTRAVMPGGSSTQPCQGAPNHALEQGRGGERLGGQRALSGT